jgi:hypothetical protein
MFLRCTPTTIRLFIDGEEVFARKFDGPPKDCTVVVARDATFGSVEVEALHSMFLTA